MFFIVRKIAPYSNVLKGYSGWRKTKLDVDPKPPNLAAKLNIFSINRKAAGK